MHSMNSQNQMTRKVTIRYAEATDNSHVTLAAQIARSHWPIIPAVATRGNDQVAIGRQPCRVTEPWPTCDFNHEYYNYPCHMTESGFEPHTRVPVASKQGHLKDKQG